MQRRPHPRVLVVPKTVRFPESCVATEVASTPHATSLIVEAAVVHAVTVRSAAMVA